MPSSVNVGSRPPRSCLIFSYSSVVRPCERRVSGEKAVVREVAMGKLYCRISARGWIEKLGAKSKARLARSRSTDAEGFRGTVATSFDSTGQLQVAENRTAVCTAFWAIRRHRGSFVFNSLSLSY